MTTPDLTPHDATWLEELIAYRDGELPLLRRWAVRWHLASCAACREELLIMTQISEQLRSAESETFGPHDTLDATLRNKILASVAASEPVKDEAAATPPTSARPPWWQAGHGRELMALGACAVVFAVAATTMFKPHLKQGFNTAASAINTSTDGPDTGSSTATSVTAVPDAIYDKTMGRTFSRNSSLPQASAPASGAARTYPLTESDVTTSQRSGIGGPVRIGGQDKSAIVTDGRVKWSPQAAANSKKANEAFAPLPPGATSTDNMPTSLRRVHKEGRITVAVEKVEEQSDAVTQMVKSAGGFVADNALSTGGDGLKTATLSLKVPVKQFESVMGQIARLGDVKAKNIVGEDITEKFSDVEQADHILSSELGVREEQLKAAIALADTKRKHAIPVPWQQRAEVRELRIQAAQMRARLDLLKKISDLATIDAQIQEKPHVLKHTGVLGDINDNTASALDTFTVAARVPVNLLLWILAYSPLWLPLLVAYFCLHRIYRRA